jgi:hypothetical protein
MSRSSSVSTKDKTGQSKKPKAAKQRRDDSESFDVRSQYTPFFPQPQMQSWIPTAHYAPMGPQQFSGGGQNAYQNSMPPQFVGQTQQFSSIPVNNGNMQTYNNMPQVINRFVFEEQIINRFSNIHSPVSQDFSRTALLLQHMAHPFNLHPLHHNNGSSNNLNSNHSTRPLISPEAP